MKLRTAIKVLNSGPHAFVTYKGRKTLIGLSYRHRESTCRAAGRRFVKYVNRRIAAARKQDCSKLAELLVGPYLGVEELAASIDTTNYTYLAELLERIGMVEDGGDPRNTWLIGRAWRAYYLTTELIQAEENKCSSL